MESCTFHKTSCQTYCAYRCFYKHLTYAKCFMPPTVFSHVMKYRTVLCMRAVLTSRPSTEQHTLESFTPFKLPPCDISLPAMFWDPHVNARVTPRHPCLWASRRAERSSLQSAETNTSHLLLAFLPFYRRGRVKISLFLLLARQCYGMKCQHKHNVLVKSYRNLP